MTTGGLTVAIAASAKMKLCATLSPVLVSVQRATKAGAVRTCVTQEAMGKAASSSASVTMGLHVTIRLEHATALLATQESCKLNDGE